MSHESTDSQRASRKDEHLELAMRLHGHLSKQSVSKLLNEKKS